MSEVADIIVRPTTLTVIIRPTVDNVQVGPSSFSVSGPDRVQVVYIGIEGPPGGLGLRGYKGDKGDRGEVGPQGGGGDLNYIHVQNTPSQTWVVVHNLGKRPTIACVDSGGTEFDAAVNHIDDNHLIVTLSYEISGKVYCN